MKTSNCQIRWTSTTKPNKSCDAMILLFTSFSLFLSLLSIFRFVSIFFPFHFLSFQYYIFFFSLHFSLFYFRLLLFCFFLLLYAIAILSLRWRWKNTIAITQSNRTNNWGCQKHITRNGWENVCHNKYDKRRANKRAVRMTNKKRKKFLSIFLSHILFFFKCVCGRVDVVHVKEVHIDGNRCSCKTLIWSNCRESICSFLALLFFFYFAFLPIRIWSYNEVMLGTNIHTHSICDKKWRKQKEMKRKENRIKIAIDDKLENKSSFQENMKFFDSLQCKRKKLIKEPKRIKMEKNIPMRQHLT